MGVILNKPAKAVKDAFGTIQGIGDQFGGVVIERRAKHKKDNFRVRRPNVLDNMDACVSGSATRGWQKGASIGTMYADFDDPRPNTPCFCSLAVTTTSSFATILKDFGDLPDGGIVPSKGHLILPVKLENIPITAEGPPATEVQVGITVMLSTTNAWSPASAPAMATAFSINTAFVLRQGWNDVMISPLDDGTLNNIIDNIGNSPQPGWKYEGTSPGNADTVYRYMRIAIGSMQPTTLTPNPVIKFGGVFQGGAAQPNILIHCDDGHKDTIDLLRIYNARKIPVTVGVITGSPGKPAYMSVETLHKLYDEGNDIVSHTETHPVLGMAGMTPEKLKSELETSLNWLRNNKFPRTSDFIVYPENNYRERDLKAVKEAGYTLGRGSRGGRICTLFGIDNALALGSRDYGGKTLAQVKKIVESAQVYKCSQILYMHQIASITLTSLTFADGTGTAVHANGTAVPVGTLVYLRGADSAPYNIAAYVETSTPSGFTFKYATAGIPNAVLTRSGLVNPNLRFYSPTWPSAGGPPPASTLYWYMSDHIAFANFIADEWAAGRITPICMAELAERCMLG